MIKQRIFIGTYYSNTNALFIMDGDKIQTSIQPVYHQCQQSGRSVLNSAKIRTLVRLTVLCHIQVDNILSIPKFKSVDDINTTRPTCSFCVNVNMSVMLRMTGPRRTTIRTRTATRN